MESLIKIPRASCIGSSLFSLEDMLQLISHVIRTLFSMKMLAAEIGVLEL